MLNLTEDRKKALQILTTFETAILELSGVDLFKENYPGSEKTYAETMVDLILDTKNRMWDKYLRTRLHIAGTVLFDKIKKATMPKTIGGSPELSIYCGNLTSRLVDCCWGYDNQYELLVKRNTAMNWLLFAVKETISADLLNITMLVNDRLERSSSSTDKQSFEDRQGRSLNLAKRLAETYETINAGINTFKEYKTNNPGEHDIDVYKLLELMEGIIDFNMIQRTRAGSYTLRMSYLDAWNDYRASEEYITSKFRYFSISDIETLFDKCIRSNPWNNL